MVTTLKFLPGSTIRWRATRFVVVDYADIDAIIARELGKRKLERIPGREHPRVRSMDPHSTIWWTTLSGRERRRSYACSRPRPPPAI